MRESPRSRRLRSDRNALELLRSESTILDFDVSGHASEYYLIRFHGKGLWRPDRTNSVLLREVHEVRINLGASYPRMMPDLRWVSPIFHPNISASGIVCLGGYGTHWVPSLGLAELCEMLWDIARYRNYDVDSPYNREAAYWARSQQEYRLPVDPRPIRDRIAAEPRGAVPPATVPPATVLPATVPAATVPAEAGPAEPVGESTSVARAPASSAEECVLIIDGASDEIVTAEVVECVDQDILFLD